MQTTTINDTGLSVSAIGFGAMHLSIDGRPSREEAVAVVHHVLDLGVTFFDGADSYCLDESDKHHNEELIREAFDAYDGDLSDVVFATKGGLMRTDGDWPRNGDPRHLRRTIRESVEALGGGPIRIWQHHAPDPEVPVEKSLEAVRDAVDEGLIEYVGVSNYSVEQIERARELVDVVSVQNKFSLWHRKPLEDGVLEYCERENITFLPYSPLGGRRRAKKVGAYAPLSEIADTRGGSPHQVALAWLMAQSPVVLPIPGASRKETIEDSLGAVRIELSDDDVRRIGREVK